MTEPFGHNVVTPARIGITAVLPLGLSAHPSAARTHDRAPGGGLSFDGTDGSPVSFRRPAPLTLSTMSGCPSELRMGLTRIRAIVSVGPPAGNGTIIVTGRDG